MRVGFQYGSPTFGSDDTSTNDLVSSWVRAYAFSRGKVCIGLKTDVRSLLTIGDNPMVECALRGIFGDIHEISEWIRSRQWEDH